MFKNLPSNAFSFYTIYLVTFLFALHYAIPLYVNSSFLGQFLSENIIGLLYAIASLATIFVLAQLPTILSSVGNYKVVHFLLFTEALALLTLAFSQSTLLIVIAFITNQILITLILFNLDVFLESISQDKTTGTVRGIFLTVFNAAILLGPLLAGIIITNGDFGRMYLASAIFLLPVIWLVTRHFKNFKDPLYDRASFWKTLKKVFSNDDLRHVVVANFIMRFFFSWMVIYMPFYLNTYIGFSWSEIGIILGIMLLPFVLFEASVGRLADTRWGEKEFMISGFIIAAFFTATLSFVETPSLMLWAALLFGSRIGISFIDTTSESYFFKHVDASDTNILGIFRDTRPMSYLVGPLVASMLLIVVPFQYLFLILSFVLLFGAVNSLGMRDTK